jgi:hypothetical protein
MVGLWVELTGGIFGENGWQIDAVDFQKLIESLMVVFPPDRIPIRGEHQCTANLIEVQSPIRAVSVLRVLKGTEIVGMVAMRVPIFGLDCEGFNAVDGYFHGLFYGLGC